jgi:hypothetical protein
VIKIEKFVQIRVLHVETHLPDTKFQLIWRTFEKLEFLTSRRSKTRRKDLSNPIFLTTNDGSRNFHTETSTPRFKTACGTSTPELPQQKKRNLHNKKAELPQQKSGTSTTVDFFHFLVIKNKKFLHIRVPHIEKPLDTKNQLEKILKFDFF